MIKNTTLLTLLLSSSLSCQPSSQTSRTFQTPSLSIAFSQQITNAALNNSPYAAKGLFRISEPGYYLVSTDLSAAPARSNLAILHINASNVIVDLGSKTLTLSTTNYTAMPSAITIAPNVSNVTIMNGTINGAGAHAAIATGIAGSSTSGLHIDNIRVINCSTAGITAEECANISISRVHTHNTGPLGVYLYKCTSGFVSDSTFSGCTADTATACGLWAKRSRGFSLENVAISNIASIDGNTNGALLECCSGFSCNNLHASNNTARVISKSIVDEFETRSCGEEEEEPTPVNTAPLIPDAAADPTESGLLCIGINLTNSHGFQLQNCSANSNAAVGTNTRCFGFLFTNKSVNNRIQSCQATNNYSNGNVTAGFFLYDSRNNSFDTCESMGNHNTSKTAAGFYSTNSGSRNFFRTCKANANYSLTGKAIGISLHNETRSIICNSEINANDGGSGSAFGLALTGTCTNVTVEYNKIFGNYAATTLYGFKDFAADSTTLLRGNVAFGQGRVFHSSSTPIDDSGSMNYMLTFKDGSNQKNLQFIIKEGDTANLNSFEAGSQHWFNFSITN